MRGWKAAILFLHCTGDVLLQAADEKITSPFETVIGATSPYSPPTGEPKQFYRLKIQ